MPDSGVAEVAYVNPQCKQANGPIEYMVVQFKDGSSVRMTLAQYNGLSRYWTRD